METHNHEVLKLKALEWLYLNAKCSLVATEVQIGKYIFDVIGTDGSRVFIIEAKQDYNDFKANCNCPALVKININRYKNLLKETNDVKMYKELIEKERTKNWKFYDNALYRLASHRYIIAPDLLIDKEEIPLQWGLLNEDPRVVKRCDGNRIDKKFVEKIMIKIAKKNTKNYLKSIGVEFDKTINFPESMLL